MIIPEKYVKRFWSHVVKTDGCWLWTGGKSMGYGAIAVFRVSVRSHVFSWRIHNGEITDGLYVCHNCKPAKDNKLCVNPAHLWLGTTQQNIADAVAKDTWATGAAHWFTKIPDSEIPKIFEMRKGGGSQTEIAARYGVHQSQISCILSGKRRKKLVASLQPA